MLSKNKQHKNDPKIKITDVILFVVSGEEDQFVVDLFYHMNNLSSSVCGLQTSVKRRGSVTVSGPRLCLQ